MHHQLSNRLGIEAQTAAYDLDAITEGLLSVSRIMNYVIAIIKLLYPQVKNHLTGKELLRNNK